ncbi:MAG: phage gp6-like head-tail connector protein [Anaerolineales bacterium]|nr:phage gp6-like head-tail connector protein [Anaerolineales bacterium]
MAYASLAQLKEYLGTSSPTDDDLMTRLLAAAQAGIEQNRGGRRFEAVDDEVRYVDYDDFHVVDRTLYLDDDLCQITQIVNGDGTIVSPDDYVTIPRHATPFYAIRLKQGRSIVWTYSDTPEDAIAITGRWAYSVTPSANVTQATIRLAAWMYRQKDTSKDSGDKVMLGAFGPVVLPSRLPSDVLDLLPPAKEV